MLQGGPVTSGSGPAAQGQGGSLHLAERSRALKVGPGLLGSISPPLALAPTPQWLPANGNLPKPLARAKKQTIGAREEKRGREVEESVREPKERQHTCVCVRLGGI